MKFRLNIFIKLLLIFVLISVVPLLVHSFVIISTYENMIEEYAEREELIACGDSEQAMLLTHENIKIHTFLATFLVITLILFIIIILNRNLVYPLQQLLQGTQKIIKGDFETKINVKTKDEIEDLANAFNEMVKNLKASQEFMEESKAVLEIKVKARTRELKEMADNLEREVEQRTKELQRRLKELEKFHKLTVGREIRMVELKKEIKDLEEKLKNKK